MRLREAVRFSAEIARLLIVDSKRDCRAPSLARSPLMKASAESTVLRASVALITVVTSRSATFLSVEAWSPLISVTAVAEEATVESSTKDFSESKVR